MSSLTEVRPFRADVPEAELTELRRRINATRWPERETVTDDSQSVPLAMSNRVDIGPEAPFVRHKHPGEEIIYVLEGSLEYRLEGQEPMTLNAGDVLLVPAETVHAVENVGSDNASELSTYFVEKDKPFLVVLE